MSVAVQTAHIIRKIIQGQNTGGFFWKSIKLPHLPEGLYELLVIYHPALETSFWEQSNNLGISENVVDDIRKAILKKDEKLKIYQKQRLNYYWLLITTDRLRGVKSYNLSAKILNYIFQSQFQHVFLFDLIKSDVFQLI